MTEAIGDLLEKVAKDSNSYTRLREVQRLITVEHFVPTNCFRAEVWQRDPWVDLTHQDEFYSSSGLRGVQFLGRGPKGRLAPVIYLDDPSLCCLDIRDSHKRLIRCRLIASSIEHSLALFVDGVEGTNQVPPKLIHRAILDYAKHCGFEALLFNATVHNRVPQRFVRYLSADHVLQAVHIRSVDSTRRQYLDAFSWPLEPMEYKRASGVALAYASKSLSHKSMRRWRLFHSIRMNCLNLIAILAVTGAAISALSFQPMLVIALVAITSPLLIIHLKGRTRSDLA